MDVTKIKEKLYQALYDEKGVKPPKGFLLKDGKVIKVSKKSPKKIEINTKQKKGLSEEQLKQCEEEAKQIIDDFNDESFDVGLKEFAKNRHYDYMLLKKLGLKSEGQFINIPVSKDYIIKKPIRRDMGIKSIKPPGKAKPWFIKGNSDICVIVEGETDAIAIKHIKNDFNVFSLGGVKHIKLVQNLKKYFNGKKIIICFDNDDAGKNGLKEIIDFFHSTKDVNDYDVRILQVPEYKNDIDDFFFQYGDNDKLLKLDRLNIKSNIETYKGNFIEYLKTKTNQEIRQGQFIKCVNPEHDDRTPSMMVYESHAYCFGCGYRICLEGKKKKEEIYEEKEIVVEGVVHEKEIEIGPRGGKKEVTNKVDTHELIVIRVFPKRLEFYHNDLVINTFKFSGTPTNTDINSFSRVLLDIGAFNKTLDARNWIHKENIFQELKDLKESLTEKRVKERKKEELMPVEKKDLVWNFNFDIHNIEDYAFTILNKNPLYYTENKEWLKWNDAKKKWEKIMDHYIIEFAKKMFEAKGLSKSINRTEILNAIKDETVSRKPKELKETEIQIGTKIYDITNDDIREATPNDYSLIVIPHEMDDSLVCPNIDKIFKEWYPQNPDVLYDVIAFMMSPTYFLDINFWLVGSGENGKGLFEEVISKVIGSINVVAQDVELLSDPKDRFTKGFLKNKLMCNLGDGNSTSINNTKALKTLSGNKDPIRCEIKGGSQSEFKNTAKLIGAFNTLPETNDKTKGFYRRAFILEFQQDFAGKKNPLPSIPESEYTALATKCFKRLKRIWKEQTLTGWPKWYETKEKWEYLSNPLKKFIDEEMVKDCRGFFTVSKFIEMYQKFAHRNGFNEFDFYSIKPKLDNLNITKLKKVVYITNDGHIFGKEKEIPNNYIRYHEDLSDSVDRTYEKTENKITVYNGYKFKKESIINETLISCGKNSPKMVQMVPKVPSFGVGKLTQGELTQNSSTIGTISTINEEKIVPQETKVETTINEFYECLKGFDKIIIPIQDVCNAWLIKNKDKTEKDFETIMNKNIEQGDCFIPKAGFISAI